MKQTLYFILYQVLKYVFHIYYALKYYLWSKSTYLAYLLPKHKNGRENNDITFVILLEELAKLKRKMVFVLLCLVMC